MPVASFLRYLTENDGQLSIRYQEDLNSKIWDSQHKIHPDVREQLLAVANEFVDFVEAEFAVVDVILTGSLANYNWTEHSDLDVHIIVDLNEDDVDNSIISIQDAFKTKKYLWNEYHDISIKGFPVEPYIQLADEEIEATAIYSLVLDRWIRKPKREDVTIDRFSIKKKAIELIDTINKIIECDIGINAAEAIERKIYQIRKSGLDKRGEMSSENLVFKEVRNSGTIDRLRSYIRAKLDQELSSN